MSNRFYIPERLFRVRDDGTLLAYFSFVDNETGLEYSNWRLVTGKEGVFVSSPFESYDHKEKGMQYYNYVKPAYDSKADKNRNPKGVAFMTELSKVAHAFYQTKQSGAPVAAGSGRGPVATEDPDDKLPF